MLRQGGHGVPSHLGQPMLAGYSPAGEGRPPGDFTGWIADSWTTRGPPSDDPGHRASNYRVPSARPPGHFTGWTADSWTWTTPPSGDPGHRASNYRVPSARPAGDFTGSIADSWTTTTPPSDDPGHRASNRVPSARPPDDFTGWTADSAPWTTSRYHGPPSDDPSGPNTSVPGASAAGCASPAPWGRPPSSHDRGGPPRRIPPARAPPPFQQMPRQHASSFFRAGAPPAPRDRTSDLAAPYEEAAQQHHWYVGIPGVGVVPSSGTRNPRALSAAVPEGLPLFRLPRNAIPGDAPHNSLDDPFAFEPEHHGGRFRRNAASVVLAGRVVPLAQDAVGNSPLAHDAVRNAPVPGQTTGSSGRYDLADSWHQESRVNAGTMWSWEGRGHMVWFSLVMSRGARV